MLRTFYLCFLLSIFFSCKEEEKCVSNCAKIVITGQIIDASKKKGISKVPIDIYSQSMGILNSKIKLGDTKTNKNGQFTFSKTIDKELFTFKTLNVVAHLNENFISSHFEKGKITTSIYKYSPTTHIEIVMHPEVDLTINLLDKQNDNFKNFTLTYSYNHPYTIGIYSLPTQTLKDTSITVKTAAGKYTIIEWRKNYGPGINKKFVDSVFCETNKVNIISIPF